MSITLGEYQQFAIDNISKLDKRLYIITGGAGVGKTTVLQHLLIKLWSDSLTSGITRETTYIGCPTGKSAKVVNDAMPTDFLKNEAKTIHRLLCFDPGTGWGHDKYNPINATLIVCDESSMIGSLLLSKVIAAMPSGCILILVGDSQQLSPVDPGSPFHDLINHGDQSAVYRLDKNYRQQHGSLIAHACSSILSGTMPTWGTPGNKTLGGVLYDDLFFHEEEDKELIPEKVHQLCKEMWANGDDFIILSPQRTGVVGTEAMNKFLQQSLNPPAESKTEYNLGWAVIREGDRVIQTRNNYELDCYNGFTGVVVSIKRYSGDGSIITVDFDGQLIEYSKHEHIKDLALGYVITGHKSQGSQWAKGIVIMHSSHFYMASRNLLYTMVSRFRKELYVVGDKRAVKRGLSNVVSGERNTLLKLKLAEKWAEGMKEGVV